MGTKSASTVVPHTQPLALERLRVMVLSSTNPGALTMVQLMLPSPVAATPLASMVQLAVLAWPPRAVTLAMLVPWFIRSSKGTLSAVISARPAVTLVRAWCLVYIGKAMVARMPMMATTIISSISVKPF
ncbi:hypothetical protein D9M72_631100 [compost metagenome]